MYAKIEVSTPPIPMSKTNLQHLIASIAQPAEFGESSTFNLNSNSFGTAPNILPSPTSQKSLA
jgi:hypothetical protein